VNLIADENPAQQAARMPAGLASDIVAGGSLQDGPGKLYLPIIFKNYDPALYALVPNVQGLTQSDAGAAIVAANLTVGTITQGTSPTVPVGRVISQNPAAGSYATKGTAVNLVISTGPAMVNVPNVVDRSRTEAEGLIVAASLLVGTVTNQYHNTVLVGNVISQSPLPGTLAAEGTAVNLWVSLGPQGIPPDPSKVAPPINPTVATTVAAATDFLYTGAAPIQGGVSPGTIEARRAAVIRGKVLDRGGLVLPGVTITILNHPEFGQTMSRADGMFDMVVNGGGYLTVKYQKSGYLEVQRQLNVPWQDYVWAPDVILVALDANVTTIDLTSGTPIQVARGSTVTDADGTRQATLLIPQGTQAQMVMPDGSTQPLTSLNVRATEYTIGPNGPKAMPAELPPTSGYTYAVELSADEALLTGASSVHFDRPFYFYVEDFIGFPVGGAVPSGYYDRQTGQWIASENGRVIRILSITGGLADIDTDGDGNADSGLGITNAERQQLATLYPQTPKQLWRVPMTHFTPWDCNWPYGPPIDAVEPNQSPPKIQEEDQSCESSGSIIECQNQVLGERLPVVGTPFTLNYRSNRVTGSPASRTLNIPLIGGSVPGSLMGIVLKVTIAGRTFEQEFGPTPNQSATFVWDGLDAYGRPLQGSQRVNIGIGYVYRPQYYPVRADLIRSFARSSPGLEIVASRDRSFIILLQNSQVTINRWDARGQRLGGWSLDVHHAYDPAGKILYLGNGQQRSAFNQAWIVDTVAGNGQFCNDYTQPCGDGGKATDAQLYPWGVDVGPDGSLYITDEDAGRIWRVKPDGIITHVAGLRSEHYWCDNAMDPCGDGGPATQALFGDIYQSVVGPDGSIYISDETLNRIRKVDPKGIITTVAGTGERGFGGDGGPATQAKLNQPYGVRVGPDGSLYIADEWNNRIRRVGTDGIITTVAGNGTGCDPRTAPCGDGGPATEASVGWPLDVAVGRDGSLYIPVMCRIRKVTPDGIITTVAGTGECGYTGDGGPAINAKTSAGLGIAVAPDGTILFTDEGHIRRIGPDGIISTIAGVEGYYPRGYGGDNGPATAAKFFSPWYIAIGPDGQIYIADAGNKRLRRMRRTLPGSSDTDIVISSEDGKELYDFDRLGRHLRTVNTLSGTTVYQFSYDPNGLLISVQDLNGNITTVERDGNGTPTGILGPYGQRTIHTHDTNGYLSGINNPAGEATSFEYTNEGLMTKMTTPRGHSYVYTYDSSGRLTRDDDPAGGFQTLTKTELPNGYEVIRTTALGRNTIYRVENLPTGEKQMTNIAPDGTQASSLLKTDGTQTMTAPDGTVTTVLQGPDPRFGMQSPILKSFNTQTPGGLTYSVGVTRSVSLSNPNDLLSLTSLTDSLVVNSRTYQSQYTAATKQRTTTSPEGRQTVTTLDALGRVVKKERPGIEPISMVYDANGRLTTITQGPVGNTRDITLDYNPGGFVSSVTDPLSRTVSFEYDQAGRVTRQILPGGREVLYSYDANGNMTSITPPSRPSHTFDYTQIDLVEEYTPPPAGTGTGATTYTYNTDRQLTQVTRPDGRSITFGYDSGGRLSSRNITRGTTSYAYYSQTGNLSSITAPDGGVLSYTYDGTLLKSMTWQGAVQGSLGLTYDNNLRVVSQTVNGDTVSFTYDNDSLLTQAGALGINRNSQTGLITGTTLGVVTDSRTYTTFAELSDYSASANASEVFRIQYTRDNLGRVTEKTETISGTSKTYSYLYDAAGRLAEVKESGSTVAAYAYDANGNRLSYTGSGGTFTYTYDDQDRLLNMTSGPQTQNYTYTGNGELATKTAGTQITTYQYDELGNLVAVTLPNGTPVEYLIDGMNRRIGKKVNNVLSQGWLYKDRLYPVAELDGSGTVVSRFVYGTKKNVPNYIVKGGVTYLIVSDYLGSVRLVVNATSGVIAQHLDYDAFGNVIQDTSPGFQPFGFAGGLYDRDTKLTRFGVRDYDAETGRWTVKDPIRFAGRDMNLYEYVLNDPVNWMDPSGLLSWGDVTSTISDLAGTVKGLWDDLTSKKETVENIAETVTEVKESLGEKRTAREGAKVFSCILKRLGDFLPDSPIFDFESKKAEMAAETLDQGVENIDNAVKNWHPSSKVEFY
jgi:RHS repeat-associated protein